MKAKDLLRVVKRHGCEVKSGKGGHVKVKCGRCATIIAMHSGDMPKGTAHGIVKDLEPCLGKNWHKE